LAARKFYKTEEELRAKFIQNSGQIDVFAVRPVLEEVIDPKKEFTAGGSEEDRPQRRSGAARS